MGARALDEARPTGRAPWAPESDDPTTRVWKSMVLQALNRPPNPDSRVESQERIRCEIMSALEAAIAETDRETPPPVVLAPLQLRPPPNPFLQPRLASDPPPPWVLSAAQAALLGKTPRIQPSRLGPPAPASAPGSTRPRRRSILPFVALAMAVAIGLGLCVDRGARMDTASAMKAQAKLVSAHASKVLARRGH